MNRAAKLCHGIALAFLLLAGLYELLPHFGRRVDDWQYSSLLPHSLQMVFLAGAFALLPWVGRWVRRHIRVVAALAAQGLHCQLGVTLVVP
jgi:hypothetical protein